MAVRAFTSVCANVVLCPEIHISDRDVGAGRRIRAEDAVRGATLAVGNIAVPVLGLCKPSPDREQPEMDAHRESNVGQLHPVTRGCACLTPELVDIH